MIVFGVEISAVNVLGWIVSGFFGGFGAMGAERIAERIKRAIK